jgi:hypothetical protein
MQFQSVLILFIPNCSRAYYKHTVTSTNPQPMHYISNVSPTTVRLSLYYHYILMLSHTSLMFWLVLISGWWPGIPTLFRQILFLLVGSVVVTCCLFLAWWGRFLSSLRTISPLILLYPPFILYLPVNYSMRQWVVSHSTRKNVTLAMTHKWHAYLLVFSTALLLCKNIKYSNVVLCFLLVYIYNMTRMQILSFGFLPCVAHIIPCAQHNVS